MVTRKFKMFICLLCETSTDKVEIKRFATLTSLSYHLDTIHNPLNQWHHNRSSTLKLAELQAQAVVDNNLHFLNARLHASKFNNLPPENSTNSRNREEFHVVENQLLSMRLISLDNDLHNKINFFRQMATKM